MNWAFVYNIRTVYIYITSLIHFSQLIWPLRQVVQVGYMCVQVRLFVILLLLLALFYSLLIISKRTLFPPRTISSIK